MKNALATLAAIALTGAASPVFASSWPAGQTGENLLTGAATMRDAVTDCVINTVNLGSAINVASCSLGFRKLVLQTGGIVPMHSHVGRPRLI